MQSLCSKFFCNLSLLILLVPVLLLSHTPLAEAKKKAQQPASRSAVPGSGELTTKAGHSCTWATSDVSDSVVALEVSCSILGEAPVQTYQCRFTGRPDQCPAYADKANQYWKQVVGKLKKRSNACDGEKVLKTRLCKKGPSAAHVRLAERTGEEKKEEDIEKDEEKTTAPVAKEAEVAARRAERECKGEQMADEDGNGVASDGELWSNYCAGGWHSLCSFFVKFFDG